MVFVNAIPSLPGAVGTNKGVLGGALTLVSGDQAIALAVALTSHLFNYIVSCIPGAYTLYIEGETLMGIFRQSHAFQSAVRGR